LGGIIGLALAAMLLIVCFSGKHEISDDRFSQSSILKRKSIKIIMVCMGAIIISVSVIILYSYISYQRKQLIEEKEYYERKEKEKIAEQAKIEKDVQYLEHIKIISSNFGYARDLYVEIKN